MSDLTQLLRAIESGETDATDKLFPLVYEELRQIAAVFLSKERPGQTLQPTALVHEAYLRLVGSDDSLPWNSRGHFFAAAATAIRRILIDNARRKQSLKRGGDMRKRELSDSQTTVPTPDDDLLALDEALQKMSTVYPREAELVQLRYFAGLTISEAAQSLGISPRTAQRLWDFSKAWLRREIDDS